MYFQWGLERVCEKGDGEGVGNDYNLLIYNVCMLRRRWGRWGLLLMLQRVVLVTAGGGVEKLFYWLGNTGVTCVLVGVHPRMSSTPRPRHSSGLHSLAANCRTLPRGKRVNHPLDYYANLTT